MEWFEARSWKPTSKVLGAAVQRLDRAGERRMT
jgi:hypothetical protein